ncbi:MAG: protein kinase, partial [Pirellulaceae bacterium]|nr:protein kinase [Pirellulaceae bacterium]
MREDSSTGTRIDKAIAAAESEFRNGLDDVQAWSQTAYPDLQPRLAAEIEKRLPVWQVLRSPPQLVQDSGDDNGVAVGAVVGGRYELTELVGHGAQASVWTAWDVEQSERVAIKVLRRLTIGDANGLRREVEALGRLKHARIAAIRDHDLGGDRPFFVREFIVGLPLNELILDDQYLDENVAAAICRDIADAISHAHEMGVIHRDLKPANVILRTADDAPVLVDFALSKIDELTTI